jgi:hypothetical protein
MRALIAALVIAGAAGAASAQGDEPPGGGADVREKLPTPWAPSGAPKQAEDAVKHALGDPAGVRFRAVRAIEVASVRRSAFEAPVDGPLSFVCGEYSSQEHNGDYGGYAWFSVAIKRGHVLWTTPDDASDGPGVAYYSCKGAGLAP